MAEMQPAPPSPLPSPPALQPVSPSGSQHSTAMATEQAPPHPDTEHAQSQSRMPRLFLDLFSGVHAPLSTAFASLGKDTFEPFDLDRNPKHNILMRIAHLGLVGAISAAPPCKEFSRLKLRQPGPKALRTPSHMDRVPGLTEQEQRRVDESTAVHDRSRQVLRAAFDSSAQRGFEQPPSAMSWLQPDNIQLLRDMAAHCAYVPACAHGMNYYKSWACCATFPSIARLGGTCQHPPGSHHVVAGAKIDGQYVSSFTAEFPESLATALATCMAPFVSGICHRNVPISHFANLLPEPIVHRRPAICDGAGLNSAADQSNARASPVCPLAHKLLAYMREKGIIAHLAKAEPTHPIADHHQFQLVQCSNKQCTHIAEGQPFRLQLLGMLASATRDPDAALHQTLAQGVLTGIFDSIASSMQWPQRQQDLPFDAPDDVTLLHCSGNWTRAESNPETLEALLRNEIEQGWVKAPSKMQSNSGRNAPQLGN